MFFMSSLHSLFTGGGTGGGWGMNNSVMSPTPGMERDVLRFIYVPFACSHILSYAMPAQRRFY